jgi:hypothetical protein
MTTLLERFSGDGQNLSRPVIDFEKIFKSKQKISSVQNCTLFIFSAGDAPSRITPWLAGHTKHKMLS